MTTYNIRPYGDGFGIFKGRTIFGRPKLIQKHERLFDAEMHTLHLVTQDYHRELDYVRLTHQVMSTDMMQPRANEEHVYTALLLAGKRPHSPNDDEAPRITRGEHDPEFKKYDNILENHLGTPISLVARAMFEERFMTWYGQHHPEWVDPRREREYDVSRAMSGRNRYASQVGFGSAPVPKKKPLGMRMRQKLYDIRMRMFGPKKSDSNEAQAASSAG